MKQPSSLTGKFSVAAAMVETGTTSPFAALRALKQRSKNYTYLPHIGAKQHRKARLRILNQLVTITVDGVARRGFTGLQMVQKPEIGAFVRGNPEIFVTAPHMDAVFVIEPQEQS